MKLHHLNRNLILCVLVSMAVFISFINNEKEVVFFWEFDEVLENDIYMDSPTDVSPEGEQGVEEWNSDSFESGEEVILEDFKEFEEIEGDVEDDIEGWEDLVIEGEDADSLKVENGDTGTTIGELEDTSITWAEMLIAPMSAPSDAPGGISTNLMLWTKADDAGCTPGSTCSSWKDNSAYANNVETRGSLTLQTPDANHNFQPYFSNFSSSNFFDEQTSSIAPNTSQYSIVPTVFAVARVTTAGNVNGRILWIDNELGTTYNSTEPGLGIRNGQQYTTRFTNNIDKLANTYTVNKSSIFGWKIDTTLDMRLNGKSSTSSVGNPSVYGSHLTIGYGTYTNGAYFPGDIQEVIRYNAGLSATEIQKVESYLAVKYGITLDQTSPRDYLSSNGSVIWSASTAGSYNKDITAIGRDDDSSLNQKQSTSINGDILTIGYTTIASSNGANPNAFPSNNAFLSRANNGGAVNVWTQTGAPNIRKILPKVWKLQSNLSLFTGVAVQIDATTLPQETELIYLLMDDDGDFSNGGTVEVPLTPNTSLRGATTDVDSTKPYITFATEAISPGGVSTSLVQWSKADNAGCVPGSTCSSWKDLSSYLRNVTTQWSMTLSTANTAHNFYPYFTNFSSNNYFQHHNFEFNPGTIGATHSTTDQSAFAVVRATSANAKGTVVGVDYYDQYAITPRMAIQDGKQSFTSYYWASGGPAAGSNSTQKQSTNQLPINQSSVLWRNGNSTSIVQRMNGIQHITTVPTHHISYGWYYTIWYGSYNVPTNAGNGAFPGDIQEVIWYQGTLSALETQRVESYLALKYGVSLDQTSPYNYLSSDGGTIWNASTAGIYNKDITGIGRDDTSALNHKQSTSINGDVLTIGLGSSLANSNATNTSIFTADKTFLTRAHNGGAVNSWSGTNPPFKFASLPRVWKLQSVKTLPTFTLKVSGLPVDLGEVYAIFDDDGDFTSGATSIKLTNNNETTITAAQFKPYLTFATRIPDTEDPIVTLNGASTLLLYVGQTYTEQGANWTDNYDGTGTLSSPFSGSVTTTIAGTYTLSYQYTDQEGNPSAMVTRTVTVLPAPTTPTCTATPTATSGYVSILCTTIASGDILTIPNLTCTPSPSTGGNVTCIGTLLSSNPTATATNPAGPANNTVAVTLDTTAPTCSVSYSTTAPTNQSVIATLENCSESITVTSSGGYVHTFSSNGSFTFTFIDGVGNTGSILATVNTIDTIAPIGTISYDITIPTNGDVVASLSGNESIVVTNNGGSTDYTFTGNGTFTFQFRDLAGNTATAIAEVTWIDKSVIDAEISYSITGFTNQPVVATLTFLNESGVVIDNTSFDPCQGGETEVKVWQCTFTGNGSFLWIFHDIYGNTGNAEAFVDRIDISPVTGSISYSPAEGNWTNGNVIAAISFNKTDVFLDNTASTGYIFSGEGTNDFTFLFHDKWGNTGSQIATVWWIDKTIPTCTLLPSLSTPTNQDVLLTLTGCSETGVQADFWSLNLPDNASGVFKYRDKANNTGTTSYDVTWIDKIPVIGSVSYSTTGFTNQDVVATMSFNKSGVSITSGYLSSLSGNVERTGQSSVIFHDNASFTLEFVDLAGNTGSQEMIVNRIDKDPVTGTIAYDITGFTNQDVTAMISFNKTDVTITNTCGMRGITNPCATTAAEFVFTQTGTFTFFFYDKYGNTGSVTATVDRIDKMPVMGTLIYTPDSTISTSGTVEATLTTNKNLLSLSGWVGSGNVWTKEFYLNTGTSISFVDVYGNAGSINVSIYWIDKVAPTIPQLGVNTQSPYAINQPQLTFSSTDNVQLSHCSLTYLEDNGNAGTTGVITVVSPVISPFNPVLDPDEQTHTLTVTCYDTAGNSSSNSITFPPVVLFTLPHPVSNTNIEDATVTIISAEGGQITNITLTGTIPNAYLSNCMGSGADTVSPYASPVTCEIHGINQGGTITVSAEDYTIHAIGTNSASFTIDTTPSEGVIVAPTLLSAGDITDTRIQIFDAVEVSVAGISIAPTTTSGMYDNFSCTQFSTSVVMCTITIKQSWTLVVHAIDTAGNLLTLSQSYIVDKEAPNLTLSGSNPFNILQGSNFPDPGANWTDNYDGTGFIPYATSGTLNTAVVWTYLVRYTTTDRAGNSATLSRQIRVLLPDGDEDGDGYTNQEEILGGSDPFDTNSQPTDTEAPTATYTLTPATLTGGSVGVVLYASEPIRALSGWSLLLPRQTGSEFWLVFVKSFTDNRSGAISLEDRAGNQWTVQVDVRNIDKIAPIAVQVNYAPTTATNQPVTATVTLNESWFLSGRGKLDDFTFQKTFADNTGFTITFSDLVGNSGSTGILIDWIDITPPMCSVLYTTTGTTNQDVVATLTGCNEPIVITNNSGNANYTFTGNGFFLYFFRDIAGNLSVAPAVVTWIDKTLPQALSLTYIPATLTTGSVTATLTVDKVVPTPIGWQGNTGHIFTKIFTGNTSGTVTFSDVLGNANTTGFEITRIDTCNGQDCIITGSVSYTPTSSTPTSGTVTATLTLNMPGTLQTPGWTQVNATQFTKIYTGNTLGGEILSFQNSYGYTGSVNVEVTRIDRIPPTCTVTYSTTGSTNQNVQTSLINCSEPIVGSTMYLFTGNGVYFFTITDVAGNIAILPAVVTWIDKTVPQIIHLTYTPSTATNGNVEVSITLNEAGIITWRATADNLTRTNIFATNTGYTQTFSDLVGNMNSTGIAINRIDKTAPYATNLSYNPSTNTNGSVTVTLTTNETVHLPVGRNGNVTGTTFTKTYSANETTSVAFYDLAGNLGSTGISITRIQTVKPGASLTYNPTTTTSGSVTATLTADKTILLPTGRSGTATGTVFTKVYTTNENSSFLITDTLGNTGEATVIITRIDKGDPTGSIAYSPSTATSGTVQATLSLNKTGTIILNNGGSPVYTFTGNGSFTFSYQAPNGVTGETTATVTRIDHIAPQIASLTYNPATTSVGPVMATLVLNESGSVPWWIRVNDTTFMQFYLANMTETVNFTDLAGNAGSGQVAVNRIVPPTWGNGGWGWGWWGGGSASNGPKDYCPEGDFSSSYYDGTCRPAGMTTGDLEHWTPDEWYESVTEEPLEKESEYLTAYQRAYKYGITTMDTYEVARILDPITREEMSKMISVYAMTFLDKKPDLTKSACSQFEDLSITTVEMQHYMTLSCQLGLMGMNGDGIGVQLRFNPYPWLTRAEIGTILSRMFRGTQYASQLGDETYYARHLQALKKAGVMNYISDPTMLELRGNIFIMLMRTQKNG